MFRISHLTKRSNRLLKAPSAVFVRSFAKFHRYDLRPFQKLAEPFANVGILKENHLETGSCVLVDDQVALTTAHCISSAWWLQRKPLEITFKSKYSVEVEDVWQHPLYEEQSNDSVTKGNDIAVLLLKEKVTGVKPANLNYKKIDAANECLAVGFPASFAPTPRDQSLYLQNVKLGMKLACYSQPEYPTYYADLLESRTGYTFSKEGKFTKNPHRFYNVSPTEGMSGGGLFKKNQLVGLLQSGAKANTFFVPVANHQNWLQKIIRQPKPLSADLNEKRNYVVCEELFQKKIDPDCKIFNLSCEKNQISITLPQSERARCVSLLIKHGFAPVSRGAYVPLFAPTLVLVNETLASAMQKLAQMPNLKIEDLYPESSSNQLIS